MSQTHGGRTRLRKDRLRGGKPTKRKAALLDLKAIVKKWTKRLRLRDTKIKIEYRRKGKMPEWVGQDGLSWGCCRTWPSRNAAWIIVLHPDDYVTEFGVACDVEHTVLHELLHVAIDPFYTPNQNDRAACTMLERHIEDTTRALICLDRGLKEWQPWDTSTLSSKK